MTREYVENLSIDCLVFGLHEGRLKILLVKHTTESIRNTWALPGGLIGQDEHLKSAAMRILKNLTGVDKIYLEQSKAFGRIDRVPNKRVVTVSYYALVRQEDYKIIAGGTAEDVQWIDVKEIPEMIYDHAEIFAHGLQVLRHKFRHEPIGFNLLPTKFTLLQLQELYESILDKKLDKPNFRRKMMNMNLLVSCNEKQQKVAHRAAALYCFDEDTYNRLKLQGFNFEL